MIHKFRCNVSVVLEVNTCSSTSVVFPSTAFDISPRGHYDVLDVFTENVVGMQILRKQIRTGFSLVGPRPSSK